MRLFTRILVCILAFLLVVQIAVRMRTSAQPAGAPTPSLSSRSGWYPGAGPGTGAMSGRTSSLAEVVEAALLLENGPHSLEAGQRARLADLAGRWHDSVIRAHQATARILGCLSETQRQVVSGPHPPPRMGLLPAGPGTAGERLARLLETRAGRVAATPQAFASIPWGADPGFVADQIVYLEGQPAQRLTPAQCRVAAEALRVLDAEQDTQRGLMEEMSGVWTSGQVQALVESQAAGRSPGAAAVQADLFRRWLAASR